jgi:hypothetical protein
MKRRRKKQIELENKKIQNTIAKCPCLQCIIRPNCTKLHYYSLGAWRKKGPQFTLFANTRNVCNETISWRDKELGKLSPARLFNQAVRQLRRMRIVTKG